MATTTSRPKPASGALQIAAATIGNALEWFDILIYGYLAPTIALVFFPNANPVVSLLLTFGSFGLSYVARPAGAVLLGTYADRHGRKAALTLSIRLMVIGTAVMALMPSYAAVGLIAPVAIFAARLLQGFAVAGEFGSSTAFMIEHSPHRKAFFASWQFCGQQIAKLLAALFGFVLTSTLSAPHLQGWGWRIPFVFGLLVGPVGIYIRRRVAESPEFLLASPARSPARELFAHHKASLITGAGIVAVATSSVYFSIYIPTYATRQLHLPPSTGYLVTIVLAMVSALLGPPVGSLADRFGYATLMLPAAILTLVTIYPTFLFITLHPSLPRLMAGLLWATLLGVGYSSGMAALMAELFPARTRVTGLSLSYNLGVVLFGGFAPAIFTWLTAVTHNPTAPAFYLITTALISTVALLWQRRRNYGSANAIT